MTKRYFLIFIALIFSFSMTHAEGQDQRKQAQAIVVKTYKVAGVKSVSFELQYPGRTKSISRVTVVARVGGILKDRHFKEGQFVNKDALLFKIEPDIYQAEYDSARAQVEQAMAELNRAERDWQRIKASYDDGVASEQQRDAALSAYEQAKAMLETARARLKQAEINLKYTDVRAPVSGITGMRFVDTGNMVNPNTALVTITEIDPVYVEFAIPDTDLMRLKAESLRLQENKKNTLSVYILIEDKPYKHRGQIDFIDSVIDEKTSSVSVRAVFPNPEKSLMPGQFVRIIIKGLQRKNVIIVPQKAVLQTPLGPAVYVVENGRAIMKNIKLGDKTGEDFIVEEGLKPGDMVIIDNLMKLRPEMPVKIGE
ncbi:MAG: efflux RND transporter periplasmic adaptor subunit [Thermodesulfovibrionales bacterium]